MQILGSYTYVLECCLYWQRPSYCRFHQNFTRWRILSAKGEMLHWSTNSYSSLSPRSTSLHPAVLIVWGTQHGTHSFFLRGLCRDTVWTENRIKRVWTADQTNNACTKYLTVSTLCLPSKWTQGTTTWKCSGPFGCLLPDDNLFSICHLRSLYEGVDNL